MSFPQGLVSSECKLRVRCRCHGHEEESSESMETRSQWGCRGWQMVMAIEKQCHVWCSFQISSALLIGYLHYLRVHALTYSVVEYFASSTPNIHLLEQYASYRGSRQILSRRQHAPNKQCALNNDVRLITMCTWWPDCTVTPCDLCEGLRLLNCLAFWSVQVT